MPIQTLEELFVHGLNYVYDAEKQLTEALQQMAEASSNPKLQQAFQQHLTETQGQASRLEKIFNELGKQPETKPNNVVQAMRQEVQQMIGNTQPSPVRDAALIVAGNQVEHYEISAYGSLRNFAQLLGKSQCVQLLEESLEEEKKADSLLTQIGSTEVNQQANSQSTAASSSR